MNHVAGGAVLVPSDCDRLRTGHRDYQALVQEQGGKRILAVASESERLSAAYGLDLEKMGKISPVGVEPAIEDARQHAWGILLSQSAITNSGMTEAASQPRMESSITGDEGLPQRAGRIGPIEVTDPIAGQVRACAGQNTKRISLGRASRLPASNNTLPPWLSLALVASSNDEETQTAPLSATAIPWAASAACRFCN